MTPGQVRRVVTAEAMVVAVMATVAGSVLAVLYGQALAGALVATGLAPSGFHLRVTAGPFVWSAAVGLIVTMVAATSASRKASRVAPLEVLQEVAAQAGLLSRSRATVGVLTVAGGVVLLFLATEHGGERGMELALGGAASLCVAGSALGPVLLRAMAWVIGAPLAALDPGPGELARAAVLTQPRRATSTASPIMLTIALACTFLFAVATSDAASGIQRTGPDAWGLPVLIGSAVLYTVISVLNSSAMSMGDRADELRLLRAAGITPAQLTRAICWESAIVTCSGALLGTGIAVVSLVALSLAGTGEAGFVYSVPQYLAVLGLCAVSGLAGSLLSTRRARRGPLVAG
ncbi:FtsX-like permease family protein [Streptosporangium lutulentum]